MLGTRIRSLTFAALVLLLSGCAGIQPFESGQLKSHLLDADFGPAVLVADGPVVLVSQMDERPGYNSRNMLYVSNQGELMSFGRNIWVAPPSDMLTPLVVQSLESTGQFGAVVSPAAALSSDYRLVTELVRLEQDFTAAPSRVILGIRVIFVRVAGGEVLWAEVVTEEEPATSENPKGGAAAASRAAERLLSRVAGRIAGLVDQ